MAKISSNLSRILVIFFAVTLVGCAQPQNNQQRGTMIGTGGGAAAGAILGQAIGSSTEATLIGAGIGALVGGIAGNQIGAYMDQQERDLQNAIASSEAASLRREQDILTATFKGEAFFDTDSYTVKPGGHSELTRVSRVLNKYPQTTIQVAGHTDSRGDENYNQQLSEKRANAVRNVLIQNGVSDGRIRAIGYGESMPVSSDFAQNRRVEIVIVPVQ